MDGGDKHSGGVSGDLPRDRGIALAIQQAALEAVFNAVLEACWVQTDIQLLAKHARVAAARPRC